jgi:Protein of unknown function DUF45
LPADYGVLDGGGKPDDQVRLAVIQRLPWIKRQRQQFEGAERQSERELITGESHYVWGRRHRLIVIERPRRPHFELGVEPNVSRLAITGTPLGFHAPNAPSWNGQLKLRLPFGDERWKGLAKLFPVPVK